MNKFIYGLRYFYFRLFYRFNRLGWPVFFEKGVSVFNARFIQLGNNVSIEDNVTLMVPAEYINYGDQSAKLRVEDRVYIGAGTIMSAVISILIKKNVIIAQYCYIGDHDHEFKDINVPIRDQGLRNIKPVIINEGAWIGSHVAICSGVTVGKNSVVGANSVVKDDVPDYAVAAGAPARVIKKYNHNSKTWERITEK